MSKRSKTNDDIDLGSSSPGSRVLVINDDHDACELIARLIESAGWPADRLYDISATLDTLQSGAYLGVVMDSLTLGVNDAFKALDEIRSGPASLRDVPVVIIASTDTNRLFAFQSGADGYVVRPVHSDELMDVMHLVLDRSSEERVEYRRNQLMGGATTV